MADKVWGPEIEPAAVEVQPDFTTAAEPAVVEPGPQPDFTTVAEHAEHQRTLAHVIAELFGSTAEFSGRFCVVCDTTTPNCRPRGIEPEYVKTVPWLCAPCLLPGGVMYKIVRCLMVRQGEIAP